MVNGLRLGESETQSSLRPSSNFKCGDDSVQQKILDPGNSTKSLHIFVEASLKKQRTTYIDLFYLHWSDTSLGEVMRSCTPLFSEAKFSTSYISKSTF